ncbi:MAG TPA: 2-amino-4-hydroxy-6-hydroxymethyldihydropteridine diphosphokinase [Anaerolineae bacterium]|nr:2-amino-4-hydroxy-6-hydroxymethyldihydropteridine diphosphokinase [Anaerolineae bacterium]
MARAFIALGSNIAPERALPEAVRRLAKVCRVLAVSPVYETAPVGKTDQPNFLNAAALIETDLPAADLKAQLQVIERELGRVRTTDKNAPRTIDLDIALYNEAVFDLGARHIPDPDLLRYSHIAAPLADLAPDLRHPETGQTLAEIARSLPDVGLRVREDVKLGYESRK